MHQIIHSYHFYIITITGATSEIPAYTYTFVRPLYSGINENIHNEIHYILPIHTYSCILMLSVDFPMTWVFYWLGQTEIKDIIVSHIARAIGSKSDFHHIKANVG